MFCHKNYPSAKAEQRYQHRKQRKKRTINVQTEAFRYITLHKYIHTILSTLMRASYNGNTLAYPVKDARFESRLPAPNIKATHRVAFFVSKKYSSVINTPSNLYFKDASVTRQPLAFNRFCSMSNQCRSIVQKK